MNFAGIELQKGYYRVRDSEEPGWEAVARFDWVETGLGPGLGRAYFGHAFHEDRRFFVPEKHVTSGRSTIEPVVLQEALTVDATYAVASEKWDGKRRLTYRGPGLTTGSSWDGEGARLTPHLLFTDEGGNDLHVPADTLWVAFLTH